MKILCLKIALNIPLIGAIAAGEAIEAIENADEFVSVPSSMTSPNAKYFGLKSKRSIYDR